METKEKLPDIDQADLAILAQLQEDSSLSNLDLARKVHISPATCLRRVKRLWDAGLIEGEVALLSRERLAATLGHGLEAVVEVSLDRQGSEEQEAFEARVIEDDAVQQCYRVSPGPDFVLIVAVADMPAYQAFAARLLNQDANVRNVRSFFAVRRARFGSELPLPRAPEASA